MELLDVIVYSCRLIVEQYICSSFIASAGEVNEYTQKGRYTCKDDEMYNYVSEAIDVAYEHYYKIIEPYRYNV